MSSGRYETNSRPFQKEYVKQALLQKGFHPHIIADLAKYILRKLPGTTSRPIKILDLCCGDGGATYALLQTLEEQGVKVEQIVGVDNAPEQIELAQAYTEEDSRLVFRQQDVEQLTGENQYDVVVSLFGLHWIENIDGMAQRISKALKPDGLVVYFVPLEKNDLFAARRQLMTSPAWHGKFESFSIHPFADKPETYISAFSKYFKPANREGICGDQSVAFTEEDLIRFFSSWMQEVRYLSDVQLSNAYLHDLINSIREIALIKDSASDTVTAEADMSQAEMLSVKDLTADVKFGKVDGVPKILFYERFFWFHGVNKPAESNPDASVAVEPAFLMSQR